MLFLIGLLGAVLIGLLVWKAMTMQRGEAGDDTPRSIRRSPAPDDDPDFLRKLDERFRRDDPDPPPR